MLYGTIYGSPRSRDIPGIPLIRVMERGKAYREAKFCIIRFPVQLQSNMTNNSQRYSSWSAASEVCPKHLSYNSSYTPWVSVSAVSEAFASQYTISLCKAAELGLSCLRSSLISAYKARCELEESEFVWCVKLPQIS